MTSTSVFQGSFGEKPSSRVMRPPGGGSSNIFGAPEEKKAPPPVVPTALSATVLPSSVSEPTSTVSSKPTENQQAESSPSKPDVQASGEQLAAAKTVEPERKPEVQRNDNCSYKPRKDAGFNPITGEAYGPAATATAKSSVAVKQPPGGASTRLW